MAKKKKPTGKKTPKRPGRPRSKPKPPAPPALRDRRAMEGMMWGDLLGGQAPDATPLQKAQEIMYQAFDAPGDAKRIALARKALAISPDCADAYVLLAEFAETRKEALELYRKGVEAGERALGPEFLREQAGHFWGILETRPYMRARLGLAEALWTSGHRDEAIAHLREMLRLNPNDNQGVRSILADWLLATDRLDELGALLEKYPESTAAWWYTSALLDFRREGDTPEARERLRRAAAVNKHVPAYLLGTKPLPREMPPFYGLGDRDEAILYVGGALAGWKGSPGAIAWARETLAGTKTRRKAPAPEAKGPLPRVRTRLRRLPQEFDVWQADARPFGPRVEIAGELRHPWLLLVASRSSGLILAQSLADDAPGPDAVWDLLAEAMQAPLMGEPHRPTAIQARPDPRWDVLGPHLDELGIAVEPTDDLDQLDFVLGEMEKDLAGEQPPGLLEMPGVEPAQVAGFYRAAAEFYRQAPWRKLGYESAIRVECDRLESGPRYAVVMGQSGLTFGLALYDDLKTLERLWSSRGSDEENARETVALTMTFDDPRGVPDADLDAIDEFGWEVAGPEAYPTIFRKERGLSMRRPLGWELELMEGCLRAIPDFVARHTLDDTSTCEATVPVASGPMRLALSWVDR